MEVKLAEQEIFCLKALSNKLYGFNDPAGCNFVFAFLEESKCNFFIEQVNLYLPDFKLAPLNCNTLNDLKEFAINELCYIYINPIIQITYDGEEFLTRFKEEYAVKMEN